MAVDLNDAETQRDRSLIPPGVYCLEITVKRGGAGEDGWLKLAKNLRSLMLSLECKVVGGDYAGKKVFDLITLEFDETDSIHLSPIDPGKLDNYRTSVRMGRSRLRAIVDSAHALDPKDNSFVAKEKRKLMSYGDLMGLQFYAQVEEQPAREGYGPRNVIDFIITPDLPDYPKPSANTAVALKRTAAEDLNDEINI